MLCLTRAVGGKILIGKDITVTVVRIDAASVCLVFDAPPEVKIYREEIAPKELVLARTTDS